MRCLQHAALLNKPVGMCIMLLEAASLAAVHAPACALTPAHAIVVCACACVQGFTKEITMPREQWVGFIKDYDGGTLMEYVIHPKIPYADLVNMFKVSTGMVWGPSSIFLAAVPYVLVGCV